MEDFEAAVHQDDHEPTVWSLLFLLEQLDKNYGNWGGSFAAFAPGQDREGINEHLCTRLAGAITTLFSRPDFNISEEGYARLMNYHRWLALIFAVSPYRHGDHIIRNHNAAGRGVVDPLTLNGSNLRLFCLCYFPDSQIALQPELLWEYDRKTVVRLFFALLSGRALPTPEAHAKREQLLAWLPSRLEDIESPDFLPVAVLHDVVMHCSYADLPGKHAIKRHINRLVLSGLSSGPVQEMLPFPAPPVRKKPVLAVVLEWFTCQHSIYRTHSTAMRALREHFHVTGLALSGATDELTRSVFDDFTEVPAESAVPEMVARLRELQPDVVYYPSVGMFPLTVWLSNLRLAPLQLMALGHPATTHSSCIDGVLVEEDYLGDPSCFSEKVYPLPKDALPYLPPENVHWVLPERESFEERRQRAWPFALPVRVAVCASIMKINPGFLTTLAEIARRSRTPVRYCFYLGMSHGLSHDYMVRVIRSYLPDAEVNAHMQVQAYQQALNTCEMFVDPFPFGNTNGLVDTVRHGLPGVCMTGPEVHTHIDEGLFRRLGLPEELIAEDRESYIRAVVKLAEDTNWREWWQKKLSETDVEQVLFRGRPEEFTRVVYELYESGKRKGEREQNAGTEPSEGKRGVGKTASRKRGGGSVR
ncbi:cobalt ABC transporter permease [Salmonella enterica]